MKTILLAAMLSLPAVVCAQSAAVGCEGRVATVRISEIKAGGTMDGFLAAVAAHKAWFVANGVPNDEIFATRIIVQDEQTKARSFSDKQLMTFHIHSTKAPGPKHDAAYDAFVKMYRDNSDIKSATDICLPPSALK